MCLLLIDWQTHANFRLVIAANRDEFHSRASAAASWWTDHPDLLGGRDLEAMGTWLAINRAGHFAAVTNVRKPTSGRTKSRGELAVDFLIETEPRVKSYLDRLEHSAHDYNGYNFIGYDGANMAWFNNSDCLSKILPHGVYGLSNAALDTAWPKVVRLKADYARFSAQLEDFYENLFLLLSDRKIANDDDLPNTGIELDMERQLSPIFIEGPSYGTRCSTIFTLTHDGDVTFKERRFNANRELIGESSFEFEIELLAT